MAELLWISVARELFLVFLHLLADFVWQEVFVSIPEDPLYDAEDKRSRGGMNFSTQVLRPEDILVTVAAQAFVTLPRKNKFTTMSSKESSK